MAKIVFLDRDGTLIHNAHYLSRPEQIEILPYVRQGLQELKAAGFTLLMVTNQSGIGRGYFSEEAMHEVHRSLQAMLGDAVLDKIYFCPHTPDDGCHCRKPEPGMLEQAMGDFPYKPGRDALFLIGDNECDIKMARAGGIKAIFLKGQYEPQTEPNFEAANFQAAVHYILGRH